MNIQHLLVAIIIMLLVLTVMLILLSGANPAVKEVVDTFPCKFGWC